MTNRPLIASISAVKFIGLWARHRLRLRKGRIGRKYAVGNGVYSIFRETEKLGTTGQKVVLVIGFRLKGIKSNVAFHQLFQRVCIVTTPFWSGLAGFKTKLWLVDPATKNYLGIYDWRGKQEAHNYIDFLLPILCAFSVKGSVWFRQFYGQNLESYLALHREDSTS